MPSIVTSFPTDSPRVLEEIVSGEGLSLAKAARLLPGARGKPCAPSSLWRWASEGVALPGGRRVFLEVGRLGCRWFTTRGALLRFVASQNGRPDGEPAPGEAGARRERQLAEAERRLRAAGL